MARLSVTTKVTIEHAAAFAPSRLISFSHWPLPYWYSSFTSFTSVQLAQASWPTPSGSLGRAANREPTQIERYWIEGTCRCSSYQISISLHCWEIEIISFLLICDFITLAHKVIALQSVMSSEISCITFLAQLVGLLTWMGRVGEREGDDMNWVTEARTGRLNATHRAFLRSDHNFDHLCRQFLQNTGFISCQKLTCSILIIGLFNPARDAEVKGRIRLGRVESRVIWWQMRGQAAFIGT